MSENIALIGSRGEGKRNYGFHDKINDIRIALIFYSAFVYLRFFEFTFVRTRNDIWMRNMS